MKLLTSPCGNGKTRVGHAVWLTSLVCSLAPVHMHADQATSQFQVSARVKASVSLERVSAPDTVTINARDLQLGHKDVALRYRIRTNDPRGAVLRFTPLSGLTRSMTVRGLSQPLILAGEEVDILQRLDSDLELDLRLELLKRVRPGTYQLPLIVSAHTLQDERGSAAPASGTKKCFIGSNSPSRRPMSSRCSL